MMRAVLRGGCLLAALVAVGCSDDRDEVPGGANEGRLVGFVIDGQSGERLNFFQADDDKQNVDDDSKSQWQIYAVIDGEFRRARPCGKGDLNDDNGVHADGCYQLEGIPEGMTFPLIVEAPGYERFMGEWTYATIGADYERYQTVRNIRLFPKGFQVDYRLQVQFAGRPVPGAQLVCQYQPANGNNWEPSLSSFLAPVDTGSNTVRVTTDAQGVAVVPGAQLVNGAYYYCQALLSQTVDGRVLTGGMGFWAGVEAPVQTLAMNAEAGPAALYAVSSSADGQNTLAGAAAQLVITFSRPVELLADTADCQRATLFTSDFNGNTLQAALAANTPFDAVSGLGAGSETVTTSLSADGLVLTVGLAAPVSPFDPGDLDTQVAFDGIVVRPRGSADPTLVRYVGSIGGYAGCARADPYGTAAALQNARTGGAQVSTLRLF